MKKIFGIFCMALLLTVSMTVVAAEYDGASLNYSAEQEYKHIVDEDGILPEIRTGEQNIAEYLYDSLMEESYRYINPMPMNMPIASGRIGVGSSPNRAPWTLWSNGTMMVGSGIIENWTQAGPWPSHNNAITSIVFTGPVVKNSNHNNIFDHSPNVTSIVGLGFFDNRTLGGMRFNLRNLTHIDAFDLDTRNIQSMNGMFSGASSLTNLDLSSWNTGNVERMNSMFSGASSLTNLDLSSWNTGNVERMSFMFSNASSLTNLDLSNWNTGNVTQMDSMFRVTSSLTNLNLSGWNTSNVTDMSFMFQATGLTNLDLSHFNTRNVTGTDWSGGMRGMFLGADNLTHLNLSNFDTRNVVNMNMMFRQTSSLTSLDLSSFNTSNVTTMSEMFLGTNSLTNLDLSNFDTRNVTTMQGMFGYGSGITSLDLSSFNTDNVVNMRWMFHNANNLTSLDLSSFHISNVTDMNYMFTGTTSLRQLTLGSNFQFLGNADLPEVPNNAIYTGRWQNIGSGTTTNPQGSFVFTSAELMANYNGATMADTWVWQRHSQTPPSGLNGWHVVDGHIVFYRNGVRVGQGQAGPNGKYFAQGLVTPFVTADFLFNNQGHLLTGLRSYGNQWHYFHTAHGTRLLSGISGWWGWQLAPGELRYLHANGTWAADELITITWNCTYGGPSQAKYLFDTNGFLVTDFQYNLPGGLSVHSAFGEWHVMATHSFNRVGNFHEANGGGWFQPRPGVLRYLLSNGTYVTGPATVVNGRATVPAYLFGNAWTIINGHEFLFCVDGYLQFGWVYVDGHRVAYIGTNGIRVFGDHLDTTADAFWDTDENCEGEVADNDLRYSF